MMYLGDQAVGLTTSLPVFGDVAKIETGEYTPSTDIAGNNLWLNHSLGTTPDFIYIYTRDVEGNEQYTNVYLVGFVAVKHGFVGSSRNGTSLTLMTKLNYTSLTLSAGMLDLNTVTTSSQFLMMRSDNSFLLKANVTYHYIIGKFKEVTSNAS